jgi:hypothetical protein
MPRYRTEFGVLVDIPEEKAARINGLTPVDAPSPTPRKRSPRKPKETPNPSE